MTFSFSYMQYMVFFFSAFSLKMHLVVESVIIEYTNACILCFCICWIIVCVS